MRASWPPGSGNKSRPRHTSAVLVSLNDARYLVFPLRRGVGLKHVTGQKTEINVTIGRDKIVRHV